MHTHTTTTPQLDVTPGALAMLDSMHTIALTATHPSLVLLKGLGRECGEWVLEFHGVLFGLKAVQGGSARFSPAFRCRG